MDDPLFSVAGRVCVVTGGFGQLGAEVARALNERGALVAVLDSAEGPRHGVADLCPGIEAGSIRCIRTDVTDREELEAALTEITSGWSATPQVLINAAAIDAPPDAPANEVGPFEEVPRAALDRVLTVNVGGVVTCCQVFGGAMAGAGGGSIINISSIYGMVSPDQRIYDFRRLAGEQFVKPVAYSVSKSALYNLTRYLATYWGRSGVRVNTLTLSGVANAQPQAFVEEYTSRSPVGRMMRVEEAIGAMVFLASDASSYMTGANLVVDGGWTAW